MTTPTTPTGAELRAEGADAVLAADHAVHRMYAPLAREAVASLGAGGRTFDAEDVRLWVGAVHPTAVAHHHNVLPAVIGAMSRAGTITPVGWVTATRPTSRQRPIRRWALTPEGAAA